MQQHAPYLRNIYSNRVFRYSKLLAENKELVPWYSPDPAPEDAVMVPADLDADVAPAEPLPPSPTPRPTLKLQPAEEIDPNNTSDYETMHWTQLKKAVEARGERYTSRNDAIALLRKAD